MRYISCLTAVVAAAALSMSVSACGGSSNQAATSTTSAATTSVTTTSATQYPYALTTVNCGPAKSGLDLKAITTKGATSEGMNAACVTAMAVADAYQNAPKKPGDTFVQVTANSTAWACDQRQGNPNPYIECMNQQDTRERLQLAS
ncbi:hypothetical protein ACFWF7_36570 [Nocardia sp. NPDC060256]|uniref:hypothetical protein n=1 Tax=unclassified Nocardia TaxID=2637762 RepID=UPI00366385F4